MHRKQIEDRKLTATMVIQDIDEVGQFVGLVHRDQERFTLTEYVQQEGDYFQLFQTRVGLTWKQAVRLAAEQMSEERE